MKKLYLLFTLTAVFFTQNSFSQSNDSMLDKLMSSTWELYHLRTSNYRIFEEYKIDMIVTTLIIDGKKDVFESPFYLSDEIEKIFDLQKVGKRTEGRYIIIKLNPQDEIAAKIDALEIIEITREELKVKNASGEMTTVWNRSAIPE